jgi:high-affinity K+ transport system ATPase subunit B
MQEDKKLQSLLTKYAMQEPSAGFDDKVMQLVEASKTTTPYFLISRSVLRILLSVFIIVSIVLFLTASFIQPQSLAVHFSISLSA